MSNELHCRNGFAPLALVGLMLLLGGCNSASNGPGGAGGDLDQMVKCELVSIKPSAASTETAKLKIKVTNVSKQHIVRAKALVTVLDAGGNVLGSKSTYIVQSTTGGLAPGASVDEDAFVDVTDKTKAVKARFKMEVVRTQK